jgi:opacity protein-like surface antigen
MRIMHRKSLTALFSFVVLLSLAARPALAQAPPAANPRQGAQPAAPALPAPLPRLSIGGVGGVTFQHAPGGLFGGDVGYTASKHTQILVEAGGLTNVLPKATAANLNAIAASFVANGTTPFTYRAKRPGVYGLGAVRLTSKMSRSGLQPFAEGGFGLAHVTSKISAQSAGVDQTSAFVAAITPLPTETSAMLTAGVGLSIRAGKRAVVDLGYRYGRILTDAPGITTNRIYMAIRVGL